LKIKFQADADIDPDICRGLCRREPSIDFEGHVGVIPDRTPDPEVLRLAAETGRVLVSADVKTMLVHFAEFITYHNSPGVILIPSSRSLSSIIEGLLLAWLDWTPEQVRNQALWLPHAGHRE
jgi:Domain of unknown function (DUF5615)